MRARTEATMKSVTWLSTLCLLLMLGAGACNLPTQPPGDDGESPGGAVEATPTPTPTLLPGGRVTTTVEPEGEGYALEFTRQVSSGVANLHAAAYTCSGIHGSWQGEFEVELDFSDVHVVGAGPFTFTLPEGELTVEGKAPYSGSGAVRGTRCVILDVTDPLNFEITFSSDGRSAEVIMGSKGGGSITIQCGGDPPITMPFAIAWGPDPLTVPITPYAGCP